MGPVANFTYRCLLNGYSRPGESRLIVVRNVIERRRPFNGEEIAADLFHAVSRSTVYRTLQMLVEFGMVTRDPNGHYQIVD